MFLSVTTLDGDLIVVEKVEDGFESFLTGRRWESCCCHGTALENRDVESCPVICPALRSAEFAHLGQPSIDVIVSGCW